MEIQVELYCIWLRGPVLFLLFTGCTSRSFLVCNKFLPYLSQKKKKNQPQVLKRTDRKFMVLWSVIRKHLQNLPRDYVLMPRANKKKLRLKFPWVSIPNYKCQTCHLGAWFSSLAKNYFHLPDWRKETLVPVIEKGHAKFSQLSYSKPSYRLKYLPNTKWTYFSFVPVL